MSGTGFGWRWLFGVVAVVGLLAAACGDSDDDTSAGTTTTASPAVTTTTAHRTSPLGTETKSTPLPCVPVMSQSFQNQLALSFL